MNRRWMSRAIKAKGKDRFEHRARFLMHHFQERNDFTP
jgi:hypothetical protein